MLMVLYFGVFQNFVLVGGIGPSSVLTTMFVFIGPITEVVALLRSPARH